MIITGREDSIFKMKRFRLKNHPKRFRLDYHEFRMRRIGLQSNITGSSEEKVRYIPYWMILKGSDRQEEKRLCVII